MSSSAIKASDYTLLIVDDEADLREILVMSFQRRGFKVVEASNGKEAFEVVKNSKVDLVVSDIRMPGGNGIELLDNLREKHHELPVLLFLTGFAEISVEEAYDKGAEALFAKPFDFKVVEKAVMRALEPREGRWKERDWRGEITLPVEVSCKEFESARKGKIMNLGRGGFFLAMEKDPPAVNEQISFKINFTEGPMRSIEGHGTVKWVRYQAANDTPPGCGVEFTDLSDSSRSKVIELINFIKTKQYIPRT